MVNRKRASTTMDQIEYRSISIEYNILSQSSRFMAYLLLTMLTNSNNFMQSVLKTFHYRSGTMEARAYPHFTNKNFIIDATKLAEKMLQMAETGILTCKDDSCLVLYGVIRDCGYKIRRTVEQEQVYTLQKINCQKVLH